MPIGTKYAWLIIKDHIADESKPIQTNENARGMIYPSSLSKEEFAKLMTQYKAEQFRMYDDDNLYYEGYILGFDYDGFEPLDDFGTPNAGCTTIEYKRDKVWEVL